MGIIQLKIIGLWFFLYGYLIIASIDFGAGILFYYYKYVKKNASAEQLISNYASSYLEITNLFVVFFFLGVAGFFTETVRYLGVALLYPGMIAILFIIIRSVSYILVHHSKKNTKAYLFIYALTGLIIPCTLATLLTISEGGFIQKVNGHLFFHPFSLVTNLYPWSVIILATVSILFISSMFLTFYAARKKNNEALDELQKLAIGFSGPTILACLLVFFALGRHNGLHFENIITDAWMFVTSFLCFVIAIFLIFIQRNYGIAFLFVMAQFFFAFFGYGRSHLPYLIYPYITIFTGYPHEWMGKLNIVITTLGIAVFISTVHLILKIVLSRSK